MFPNVLCICYRILFTPILFPSGIIGNQKLYVVVVFGLRGLVRRAVVTLTISFFAPIREASTRWKILSEEARRTQKVSYSHKQNNVSPCSIYSALKAISLRHKRDCDEGLTFLFHRARIGTRHRGNLSPSLTFRWARCYLSFEKENKIVKVPS